MRINLLPRDEKFQEIFSSASKNVVESAQVFKALLKDWNPASEKITRIHELEHEGDLIRHELVDKLNRTFITPIDREDIYELSKELDDIMDMIQACVDRMQIYNLNFSKSEGLIGLAEIIEKATVEIDRSINDMHVHKRRKCVFDSCVEVNRLEHEGDSLTRKLLKNLFETRAGTSSLEIILWKEVFEFAESIIDKCEDVSCTIEGIICKSY